MSAAAGGCRRRCRCPTLTPTRTPIPTPDPDPDPDPDHGDPTSGDPVAAPCAPNVVIQPNSGVIYSGSSKKIAEHGGGTEDDTHVALLISNPGLSHRTIHKHVWTHQVAPTILRALDLDPDELHAVRKEGTKVLPGLRF